VAFVQVQLPKIENNQLLLDNPVTFKTGSNELTDDGKTALKQVKDFLVAKDYITLQRVEGHSDNSGNETDNLKRTQQRAITVCWLIINDIDCKRVIPIGFGSNKPVDT
jgi:outer membrane protein OmpA-like peptidoglycan-associated protein